MRRREVADLAAKLHQAIEKLATDYKQRDDSLFPDKTMDQWQRVAVGLTTFMAEMHDRQGDADRTMGGIWLISDLHDFIKSLREGRPSVADHFPRAIGQTLGSGPQHDLVLCSLAITCLIKAGITKEQAARRVAMVMVKAGIQFPPRRSQTIQDWQAIDNWREKLLAGKQGQFSLTKYKSRLKNLLCNTKFDWQSYANDLLLTLGQVRRKPPTPPLS